MEGKFLRVRIPPFSGGPVEAGKRFELEECSRGASPPTIREQTGAEKRDELRNAICGYKVGVGTYADMAESGTTSIIGPDIQVANRGVFFPA